MLKLAGENDIGILEAHEDSLSPHLIETLPVLLKGGNLFHIPTINWIASVTGSGGSTQRPGVMFVNTGTTASSTALLRDNPTGIDTSVTSYDYINWDKKLYLVFNYARTNSDSEAIARFQFKQSPSEGQLAAKGIGLHVANLALHGESYGTSRATVDLSTTLTSGRSYQIVIMHDPDTPKIEWYVNGTLKGTQSTSANIPGGVASSVVYFVNSIINGATGGVDAYSFITAPKIWQER